MGTRALSLGVKQLEHEADHSPPSSAKIMNVQCYTSTPNTSSCCAWLSTRTTLPLLQVTFQNFDKNVIYSSNLALIDDNTTTAEVA
jgi:hypothetical protein